MRAQYAANTIRNYRSAWGSFSKWCQDVGRTALPATPQTCIDHAAWCISQKLRMETVHLRLKAINHYHREAKQPLPFDASVREFLRNGRRALHEQPQGKAALTPEQLSRISGLFRARESEVYVRDRALVLFGFACGWRSAELVSLDVCHIKWMQRGILVRLGKSKTDQEGHGRVIGIPYARRVRNCPVRALKEWLAVRGSWAGPVFTPFDGSRQVLRRRLHKDAVRRAVKRGLTLAGVDAAPFGSHSLRVGMATSAAEHGGDLISIMQRAGWKSMSTVLRYIRPAEAFRRDPLAGVL